jgi:uncharacterized protein
MEPLAGFALGMAGSMHCIGMCGPIALALPTGNANSKASFVLGRVLYNTGRIVTYACAGALIGTGSGIGSMQGYGRALSILAGVAMIVVAAMQIIWHRQILPTSWMARLTRPVQRWMLPLMQRKSSLGMILVGMANGLLPCGLVVAALVGATGTGSALQGALFMAAFGVGTLPAMLAASLWAGFLTASMRARLRLVVPIIGILLGGTIVVRGLGLGIPMISPAPPTPATNGCCAHPH